MHGLWKKLIRAFHLSLYFYSWSCKNGGVEFPFQGEPWLWIDFKHLHTSVFFELMFDRDQEGTTLFQSTRCDMALMNNCRKFSFWSPWGPLSPGQGGCWRCVWEALWCHVRWQVMTEQRTFSWDLCLGNVTWRAAAPSCSEALGCRAVPKTPRNLHTCLLHDLWLGSDCRPWLEAWRPGRLPVVVLMSRGAKRLGS